MSHGGGGRKGENEQQKKKRKTQQEVEERKARGWSKSPKYLIVVKESKNLSGGRANAQKLGRLLEGGGRQRQPNLWRYSLRGEGVGVECAKLVVG